MNDVVELIKADHDQMRRLIKLLQNEPAARPTDTPILVTLLVAHGRAEEAEVYPALAEAAKGDTSDEAAEELEHSQREHLEIDQAVAKLHAVDPGSDDYPPALEELAEALLHHLDEEEETVLEQLSDEFSAARREELGGAFLAARAALLGKTPDDITRDQLAQQAQNLELSGVSDLSKAALQERLDGEADH